MTESKFTREPSELALYRMPGSYAPHRRRRVSADGTLLTLHKRYEKAVALGTRTNAPAPVYEQERVLTAMRGEYVICDANGDKQLIGGCEADPCVLVFIRRPQQAHPQTGKVLAARAAVAHVSAATDLDYLGEVLRRMHSATPLEVTLVSGGFDARVTQKLFDLFSGLDTVMNISLGHGVTDAVLDIHTGLLMNVAALTEEGREVHFQGTPLGQPVRDGSLRLAYDNTFAENDICPAAV